MQINLKLNGKTIKEEIADDLLLIDFVRKHGCKFPNVFLGKAAPEKVLLVLDKQGPLRSCPDDSSPFSVKTDHGARQHREIRPGKAQGLINNLHRSLFHNEAHENIVVPLAPGKLGKGNNTALIKLHIGVKPQKQSQHI